MPPHQPPQQVGAKPLRAATHNCRGLAPNLGALVEVWVGLGLDLVFLQEVRCQWYELAVQQGGISLMERRINEACRAVDPSHGGFKAYWGPNTASPRSAGVGILIRHRPRCGPIAVQGPITPPDTEGRFLSASLTWGGHQLTVATVYLPNASAEQQQYIARYLQPLQQRQQALLLGGDWNFVEHQGLDRVSRPPLPQQAQQQQQPQQQAAGPAQPQQPQQRQQQPPSARHLHSTLPQLTDAFRAKHPRTRSFTFHSSRHASRLDRWYVGPSLQPHLGSCFVGTQTPSDHRPVVLDLFPRARVDQGPGLRRIRLQYFWDDDAARTEFEQFLQQEAASAPDVEDDGTGAQAMLAWWGGFKGRVSSKAGELSSRVRQARQLAQVVARAPAAAALTQAYQSLEADNITTDQAAAALDNILAARQAWCAALQADQAAAEWERRRDWVHQGERPSPGMTAALQAQQPPASDRHVAALRSRTGRLVTAGRAMAHLVNHHWAAVCSAPPSDPAAQQEVLQAVTASGLHLPAHDATALGASCVTEEEVLQALKHSAPGKAPGFDGLPVDLYRKCRSVFVPLLAQLYTAIGLAGAVPPGFLDGVVITLYKAGERVQPNNYRPITLLNGDYRVLAKVLSHRLKRVQGKVIEPEQTGFLSGRVIGENLMFNQLLPKALGPSSTAVAVFLDFYKAYDTVIRDFLYAVLTAMGMGGGFLTWVKLLLTNTGAVANVNGYISQWCAYSAGVRQGCPLSPQLYLVVAQAMLSFLKAKGLGVPVWGRFFTASQYADDAQVYLPSLQSLRPFLDAMAVFKRASGQGLNLDKTLVLPIGRKARWDLWQLHFAGHFGGGPLSAQQQARAVTQANQQLAAQPSSVPPNSQWEGLQVVSSCKALGIHLQADGSVVVDWQARIDSVLSKLTFISRLPLSAFGRAFASAGYGVSKLLYAAEFAGLPPSPLITKLEKAVAKVVDRKMAPAARGRRFAGVAGPLLAGHPRTGGFGALPWKEHIKARHAIWAVKLVIGSDTTPWVHLARAQLCPADMHCPAWRRFAVLLCRDGQHTPIGSHLPVVVQRIVQGWQALPPVRDVARLPIVLGPWCANAPLWCNPFLVQQAGQPLPAFGLERGFEDLAALSTITTIQHAVQALHELQQVPSAAVYEAQFWVFWLKGSRLFMDRQHALERLQALVDAIPLAWRQHAGQAAPHGQGQLDSPLQIVDRLLSRMGWVIEGRACAVYELTVKKATTLQLSPLARARADKHREFLALACQGLPPALQADVSELHGLLSRLWSLKWDNNRKELFWRLCVDGLPNAARMHMVGEPCACGTAVGPGRPHLYWDCPVAQAVVAVLDRGLQRLASPPLQRAHVWLARPPTAGLHSKLWLVITQAALMGMDKGQRSLTAFKLGALEPGGRSLPWPIQEQIACRVAVATFWDMLTDFSCLTSAGTGWLQNVSATHPFLRAQRDAGGQVSLVVRRFS